MIAPMDQVEIVFLRTELPAMTPFLQEQGVLHLEDVPLAVEDHPGFLHRVHLPEEEKATLDTLEALAAMLKEAAPLLTKQPGHAEVASAARRLDATPAEKLLHQATAWHRTLRSLSRRRLNIHDNIELLSHYARVLRTIAPLLAEQNAKLGEGARALILEAYDADDIEALEEKLAAGLSGKWRLILRPFTHNSRVAVIIHDPAEGAAVSQILADAGIAPITPPNPEVEDASITGVTRKIDAKIAEMRKDFTELTAELDRQSSSIGAELQAVQQIAGDRIAQLRAVDRFAQSKMVAVVRGWVPASQRDALDEALKARFKGHAVMDVVPAENAEVSRIPTLLMNHPLLRPFQIILGIFNPPTYGTLDPTLLVAVSFILFYGFILGDVGYGIFIIAVALWARKRWGHVELIDSAMTIAVWMGGSTIVWGVVFGEFFGDLPERYFGLHPMLHRFHSPILLLFIALAYGAVHVPLSLVIGIREGFRHGHKKHAQEKMGMLIGLVAMVLLVLSVTGSFPGGTAIGGGVTAVFFAVSFYYLFLGMGGMCVIGALELIGLCSNIMSYARLMALGMASVALADLANGLLELPGALALFVGIPGAALVHLANIGIGVFSPTIHSLRLNYVEFLPKFYEPEGRSYQPFRKELSQWT